MTQTGLATHHYSVYHTLYQWQPLIPSCVINKPVLAFIYIRYIYVQEKDAAIRDAEEAATRSAGGHPDPAKEAKAQGELQRRQERGLEYKSTKRWKQALDPVPSK